MAYDIIMPSMSLHPIPLTTFVQSLSDDRKFIYIAGGMKKMSSIFKWSVQGKSVNWLHLVEDIIDNAYRRDSINIIEIAQSLNISNDTNHIVFCARADQGQEKKNLIGYIREIKYSHGGSPKLMNTVYLDPEARG